MDWVKYYSTLELARNEAVIKQEFAKRTAEDARKAVDRVLELEEQARKQPVKVLRIPKRLSSTGQ